MSGLATARTPARGPAGPGTCTARPRARPTRSRSRPRRARSGGTRCARCAGPWVEVSPEARTIRWDKVRAVRRALENGTYLDPNKLDVALDRAIDDAFRPREPGEGQG